VRGTTPQPLDPQIPFIFNDSIHSPRYLSQPRTHSEHVQVNPMADF